MTVAQRYELTLEGGPCDACVLTAPDIEPAPLIRVAHNRTMPHLACIANAMHERIFSDAYTIVEYQRTALDTDELTATYASV